MSAKGHQRPYRDVRVESVLPPNADVDRQHPDIPTFPICDWRRLSPLAICAPTSGKSARVRGSVLLRLSYPEVHP
jgi:hypothetical protein